MSPRQSQIGAIREANARFESLCISILVQIGFSNDTDIANTRNPDPADFVGVDPASGRTTVAEFSLSLASRVQVALMEQAIARTLRRREHFPNAQLLLILTCPLTSRWIDAARSAGIDHVWDLPKLLSKASGTPFYEDLRAFLTDVGVGDLGTLGEAPVMDDPVALRSVPDLGRGEELCRRMHAISSGAVGAVDFEKICVDSILYLFGDQFGFWRAQDPSEDGFHRRDLVARLRPKHDFWISLAHDFRSRYLVFEFKNYERSITQNEIYTTEKYLFTTALRSVAIIIARNGADDGARRAASGALREAGKLILILNLQDMCEMLHARDRLQDPEILLYQRLDTLLTMMLR